MLKRVKILFSLTTSCSINKNFSLILKQKKQASISQDQLEHALDNTKSEYYIMFSCRRSYYYKDEKLIKDGHAMLIYKGEIVGTYFLTLILEWLVFVLK
ncbi:hypothetical protein wTkk_000008 [Wolbachia endosymbiont of Trichogramma kaykai]